MNKVKIFFAISGALMISYFLIALLLFVWSAATFIFQGSPFSEDGHGMLLNIFHLPVLVLIPCILNGLYSIFYFYLLSKNEKRVARLEDFIDNLFK